MELTHNFQDVVMFLANAKRVGFMIDGLQVSSRNVGNVWSILV